MFGEVRAVDGIDLDIRAGEIYGFLGPNGAGKSTTVRMLCTLLAPTAGTATVAGFDVASNPGDVRLRIGVALQEAALDPKQTGAELLRLQGLLYGLPKRAMKQRVAELFELIDLTEAIDRRIDTYSGGMKRRLDLAAALVHNPDILFLDEPTTGLDPVSRATVWEEVRRLNSELGMTIFLTTQYLEEADVARRSSRHHRSRQDRRRGHADRPQAGRRRRRHRRPPRRRSDRGSSTPCAPSTASRSVEVHGNELVITTDAGSATISPVAVALANCEVPVRDLTLRTPTLDDVFLEMTGSRIERDSSDSEEANR